MTLNPIKMAMKINLLHYSPVTPWKSMPLSIIYILCDRHKTQGYAIWVEGSYAVYSVIISISVLSSLPWTKRFFIIWLGPRLLQACENSCRPLRFTPERVFVEYVQVCTCMPPSHACIVFCLPVHSACILSVKNSFPVFWNISPF